MTARLGCIADDTTGATDVANNLVRAGLRVRQVHGVPSGTADAGAAADAIVVALKSRTAPPAQAVAETLAAARWLREQGARQLYFKICSTFDSTPRGNIGPVADALRAFVGAGLVAVAPALPVNGRTVYLGHLFVGASLLCDSPMRQHPLTPMTDANLVRVLQAQVAAGARVERLALAELRASGEAARQHWSGLESTGAAYAVVDAVDDDDLARLARLVHDAPLVVASSGLAAALPAAWGWVARGDAAALPRAGGRAAIVAGSCSVATQAQVAAFLRAGGAALALEPLRLAAGHDLVAEALAWADRQPQAAPVLVYATAAGDAVQRVQRSLGAERAGALIEQTLASIAVGLVRRGVRRLVVAGGETSGAVVQALGLASLRIGAQIDPGVPWCWGRAERAGDAGVHVALKSGNFGATDFFTRAFAALEAA